MNLNNPNFNQMNQTQPVFKQYAVGQGIDQMEYNSIINAAMFAYKNNDAFITNQILVS